MILYIFHLLFLENIVRQECLTYELLRFTQDDNKTPAGRGLERGDGGEPLRAGISLRDAARPLTGCLYIRF